MLFEHGPHDMRIAYCDHSFHQKTESTLFLPNLLRERGFDVEFFWDKSWNGGKAIHFKELVTYDVIIIFQAIPKGMPSCVAQRHGNVIFIPMLDQFGIARGPLFDLGALWKPFQGSKVISFSTAIHAIAVSNGLASEYFKYMPPSVCERTNEPSERKKSGLNAFFWARRPSEISISMVKTLFAEVREDLNMHIHLSSDPGEIEISEEEVRSALAYCQSLTISHWFEKKEDIMRIISDCDIFVAPRLEEGIGQSFLEALSAGLCIIAADNGTMNEYLIDGVNGVLYNPKNPKPLKFTDIQRVRENAQRTATQMLKNWEADHDRLVDYILKPSAECYGEQHIYHGIQAGKPEALPLSFKRLLKRIYLKMRR